MATVEEIREAAEQSLITFIKLVAPQRVLGNCHEDVIIPAVLDEEGNEIEPERTEQRLVSEAVEAVEAQAERTVTRTHETAEEAPEGAVERTRKGIRYPQLLSFIGAATEQRLAYIEARLDAAGL
jgi:hypothetical protein